MELEIKHLRLVSAIARTGSVTRAGDLLNLSQSALSHQLRDIEDRLSVSLFHRVGKRMVLTTAGDTLLRAATQVLDIVGRTEDEIRKAGKSEAGLLRITTQCYTCYHWLPGLLKEYRLRHPNVEVQVDADATPRPIKSLLEGRIDVAIVSDRVRDRRLVERPLFEDELLVIMSPSHRWAGRAAIEPEDFADETLIIYPPKEESTMLQRFLAPAGVTPRALQQVQLSEAIVELVKAGLGVAVMARWAVEPHVRAGALRTARLTRKGFRRRWGAAMLRDMANVPHAKDFIDLIIRRSPVVSRPGETARTGVREVHGVQEVRGVHGVQRVRGVR
jgi:LysR family transcriptional regulator, regulator for metE and metH